MMDCKVCGVTSITAYICADCNVIKDCCNLYTRDVVIEVLRKVLIRDDKQRQFKIDTSNKQADKEPEEDKKRALSDDSYLKKDKRESERLKDKPTK